MKYLVVMVLLALAASAFAAPSEFDYGVKLFQNEDYYRSITELERFRYFEPQSKDAEGALWLIAAAYLEGEKWDLAQQSYEEFIQSYPSSPHALEAKFYRAESIYEARNLDLAQDAYQKLLQNQDLENELAETVRIRLASLSLIRGQWQDAASQFAAAQKLDADHSNEIGRWEKLSLQGEAFKPYSVPLSFLSSAVIPGTGQMECGDVSDGLSSLFLVGTLAAWSAFFYATHQQLNGGLFCAAAGVFHLGNLQGAIVAAKRANHDRPRSIIKQILDEIGQMASPDPSLAPWIPGNANAPNAP